MPTEAEQSALTYDMLEIMHIPQKCRGTTQRETAKCRDRDKECKGRGRWVERELCVLPGGICCIISFRIFQGIYPGYLCILHCALPSGLPTILFVLSVFVLCVFVCVYVCCVLCVFALYFSCIIK